MTWVTSPRAPRLLGWAVAVARRYEAVLWSLHSLWALAVGVGVMWLGARDYRWIRVTLFHVAFLWLTSLFVPSLVDREGEPSRWRGRARLVVNYFGKNLYQQILFFLLPIYYASTTAWSPNVLFVALVAVSAFVSTLDVFYDRHLSVRRRPLAVFFAFNLFTCINVMLPVLWSISNRVALPLSAGLAMLAFATIRYRWSDFARYQTRAAVGIAACLMILLAGLGRPLIPPAPLRILRAEFATAVDRPSLAAVGVIQDLPEGWSGRLHAVTAIHAPLGLRDRMAHRWYLDGRLISQSAFYTLTGGRAEGFRLWTSSLMRNVRRGSRIRVDVVTEGGQLVGRAEIRSSTTKITKEITPRAGLRPGGDGVAAHESSAGTCRQACRTIPACLPAGTHARLRRASRRPETRPCTAA